MVVFILSSISFCETSFTSSLNSFPLFFYHILNQECFRKKMPILRFLLRLFLSSDPGPCAPSCFFGGWPWFDLVLLFALFWF